jgi:zinc and cadmium transporter
MSYLLQIGAVLVGLALIFIFDLNNQKRIKLVLAFSGAYLFAIVVLHFMPEMYAHHGANIGLVVLAGFLLQILLDFYSTGLEHGHFHKEHFNLGELPVGAIVGLFIHEFFEGLPIELQADAQSQRSLLLAIVLHKIPITVVLYALLYSLNLSKIKMWLIIIIFALIAPFGTFVGSMIPGMHQYGAYLTAFAVGIFLHVSTTILFESSHNHKYNLAKIVIVIVGMALAWGSLLVFHTH